MKKIAVLPSGEWCELEPDQTPCIVVNLTDEELTDLNNDGFLYGECAEELACKHGTPCFEAKADR